MNILCLLFSPPTPSLAEQPFLGQGLLQSLAPASSLFLYNCNIIIHSVYPFKVRPLPWFLCLLVWHWKPVFTGSHCSACTACPAQCN